ncbi:CoA-binding protein [Nesterenkonia halophila]|uniref:CoA-binding protein n=1 Tax=Nesterenkonia halophila TaxID=302044 RepID=UPI001291D6A4|nr:CoA-binding protein [Nesterenkonia halophila]
MSTTETTADAAHAEHPHGIWEPPSPVRRLQLLHSARSIAIVGASNKPQRASHFVATYLLSSSSYRVHFINPRLDEILGQPVYPSLAELPEVPDIVDIFRRPEDVPGIVEEAAEVGAQTIWMQLGIRNPEAAQLARDRGMEAVQDRCVKIEHARFHGGLNLAGFNTGVISAKRQRLDG